jgi:hypothetical protein
MNVSKVDFFISRLIDDFFMRCLSQNKKFDSMIKQIIDGDNITITENTIINYIQYVNFIEIYNITKDNVYDIISICTKYLYIYVILMVSYFGKYNTNNNAFENSVYEFKKIFKNNIQQLSVIFTASDIINIISLHHHIQSIQSVQHNSLSQISDILNIFNESFVKKYFITNGKNINNAHIIIKSLIFALIYKRYDKHNIDTFIHDNELLNGEYMYIDIVVNRKNTVMINDISAILSKNDIQNGWVNDIYIELNKQSSKLTMNEKINQLINSKIITLIVDDVLLYNSSKEQYITKNTTNHYSATKIKYIVNKIEKIMQYRNKDLTPDRKQSIEQLFHRPYIHWMAILVNHIENLKIIDKMAHTKISEHNETLYNLKFFSKYPYINFKHCPYGFNIQPSKTINMVRLSTFKEHSKYVQMRTCNKSNNINVVGLMLCANENRLMSLKSSDLLNLKDNKSDNGYCKINEYFNSNALIFDKHPKYIIFNKETDKVEFKTYIDDIHNDSDIYIKNMLVHLFDNICKKTLNTITHKMKGLRMSINNAWNIIYNNLNFINIIEQPKYYNSIQQFIYKRVCNGLKLQKNDKFAKNMEILSKINVYIEQNIEIYGMVQETKKEIIVAGDNSMCIHVYELRQIRELITINPLKYNRMLIHFFKTFVTINDNLFVCKSCQSIVDIQQSVNYVEEIDNVELDNVVKVGALLEYPEYSKYKYYINVVSTYVGNICNIIGLIDIEKYIYDKQYVAYVVKYIIDVFKLHNTKHITSSKNTKSYGVNDNMSVFMYIDIINDVISQKNISSENKQLKQIIHNNILCYISICIIFFLNKHSILNLKCDKLFNIYVFDKHVYKIFKNMQIICNTSGDTCNISEYYVLCYVIYYFAYVLCKYNLWKNLHGQDSVKKKINIIEQNTIVNTIVDMLNNILEKCISKKHHLYKVFWYNYYNNLSTIYRQNSIRKDLFKILHKNKKSTIDTSKLQPLSFTYTSSDYLIYPLEIGISRIYIRNQRNVPQIYNYKISSVSNCESGHFHKWIHSDKLFKCKLCNIYISNVPTSWKNNNYARVKKDMIVSYFASVASGQLIHNINIDDNDGLDAYSKTLYNTFIEYRKCNYASVTKMIDGLINLYNNECNKKISIISSKIARSIINLTGAFVLLTIGENAGNNILHTHYINDDVYIITIDHLANELNTPNVINSSDIDMTNNNTFSYRYKDHVNMLFCKHTNAFLGYTVMTTNKFNKNVNAFTGIKINYGVINMIYLLGYSKKYIQSTDNIEQLIDQRIYNLKIIINDVRSILHIVKYNVNSIYVDKDTCTFYKTIIDKYYDSIVNIDLCIGDFDIFINHDNIISDVYNKFRKETITENIHTIVDANKQLNDILFMYIVNELTKIIDSDNLNSVTAHNIISMIIETIKYNFQTYFQICWSEDMIKFDYILSSHIYDHMSNIDNNVVGMYGEYRDIDDMNDIHEADDDANEEGLDIDMSITENMEGDDNDADYLIHGSITDD